MTSRLYIEFAHMLTDHNYEHEITVHESIDDCKYSHDYLYKCNSSDEGQDLASNEEELNEDSVDLFEFECFNQEWLVFRFYETNVESASVFSTLAEAQEEFDDAIQTIAPSDGEVKVIESNDANEMMCCAYLKSEGQYVLPDKAVRVVLMRLPEVDETVVV